MAQTLLAKHARSIADSLKAKLGFGAEEIITLLLPLLLRMPCFRGPDVAPAEVAASYYDADTDTFDQTAVERMRPKAKKAAKKDGQRKLTDEQLDEISVVTLRHAMTTSKKSGLALMASLPPE